MTCNKALGLCDAGWSFAEIGKHLGVTKGAVSRLVVREKVVWTDKPHKPHKPHKPDKPEINATENCRGH